MNNLLAPSSLKKGVDYGDQIIDDGFGAFRPSTSYNDLSSFLSQPLVTAPKEVKPEMKISKKRSIEPTLNAPSSAKRKTPYVRRVSSNSKKESAAIKKPTKENEGAALPINITSTTLTPKVIDAPIPKQITTTIISSNITRPSPVTSSEVALTDDDDAEVKVSTEVEGSNVLDNDEMEDGDLYVDSSNEKVDTSTAHIRALTGNNWVAACSGTTQGIGSVSDDTDSKTGGCNRNRHRQNLTPDERARQNRDRNREHARNTRLRKKAYVEELKRTLTELVSQRDTADIEKRHAAQRELEQREVRFRVIEEFLKLRGRNESNFARWAAILEDGFSLTLPSVDFSKMKQNRPLPPLELTLNGVSDVMANSSSFSDFLQTLGTNDGTVACQFTCERKNFFMDGCQAVLEWHSTTIGAVAKVCLKSVKCVLRRIDYNVSHFFYTFLTFKGACSELAFNGIVRGKFSPDSNKLISANLTCDTGAILLQLQKMSTLHESGCSDAAAQAAANQADALLDSIQMPSLHSSAVHTAAIIDASSSSSEGSGDDESDAEQGMKAKAVPPNTGKESVSC